jgi:protein involved in ribonucleotide reduction
MNAHEYCLMAVESRAAYRRVNLVRTALEITVSADHKQATVRAHYVEKAPQYGYGDSTVGAQDHVEHQVGTLQTETDEESVVTRNASGKLVFSATHAVSRQFRVPQERDARL